NSNPHDAAIPVYQRPARISWVDLDVALNKLLTSIIPVCRDNSSAHGRIERLAPRGSDCVHVNPNLRRRLKTQRSSGKIALTKPHQSDVAGCIRFHDISDHLPTIGEPHLHESRFSYYMLVGQEVAVRRNNHAAPVARTGKYRHSGVTGRQ